MMNGQAVSALAPRPRSASDFAIFVRELCRKPLGILGLVIMLCLLFLVAFGPSLSPYSYAQQDIKHRDQGPSAAHLLGTDHLGRDLASRLITGARVALGTALPSVIGALLIGLVLGLIAGYVGGWVDNVLLIVFDTIQSFPAMILALALLTVLGPSSRNVIFVIICSFAPGYARIARAQVMSIKVNPFVEVEQSLGASAARILLVHILPNVLPPLAILLAMDVPGAITVEAGLSFLGLGVQPPTPSWGVVLSDGFARIRTTPWPVLWASVAVMVSTLGFTLFGETLRDLLDPKLSGARRA